MRAHSAEHMQPTAATDMSAALCAAAAVVYRQILNEMIRGAIRRSIGDSFHPAGLLVSISLQRAAFAVRAPCPCRDGPEPAALLLYGHCHSL